MAKIIALSGHGEWMLGKEEFVTLPAQTSIKFYTMNMRTLSDALGGDPDRGLIQGMMPDQEVGGRRPGRLCGDVAAAGPLTSKGQQAANG